MSKLQILLTIIVFVVAATAVVLRGAVGLGGLLWNSQLFWQNFSLDGIVCRFDVSRCVTDLGNATANFGVYDPEGQFADTSSVAIEHFFIAWNNYASEELLDDMQQAADKYRWPLLTVEPWPDIESGLNRNTLLADIDAGRYDQYINNICLDIGEFGKPVFVRWGHEMEIVNGRYPWAQEDAAAYVSSYQYFVSQCRSLTQPEQVYFVWSPVGEKNLDQYWPGREYVDYVGLSIFGFPEWDQDYYGYTRSFNEIFGEKYARVEKYDRPVMVAELGVTGSAKHQQIWLYQAYQNLDNFPLLKTLIYFNSPDKPEAWGPSYPVPEWRISPQAFLNQL